MVAANGQRRCVIADPKCINHSGTGLESSIGPALMTPWVPNDTPDDQLLGLLQYQLLHHLDEVTRDQEQDRNAQALNFSTLEVEEAIPGVRTSSYPPTSASSTYRPENPVSSVLQRQYPYGIPRPLTRHSGLVERADRAGDPIDQAISPQRLNDVVEQIIQGINAAMTDVVEVTQDPAQPRDVVGALRVLHEQIYRAEVLRTVFTAAASVDGVDSGPTHTGPGETNTGDDSMTPKSARAAAEAAVRALEHLLHQHRAADGTRGDRDIVQEGEGSPAQNRNAHE